MDTLADSRARVRARIDAIRAALGAHGLAAWLLPTSFGRGLLVTLAAYAGGFVCALVLLVIAVIIVTAVRAIG